MESIDILMQKLTEEEKARLVAGKDAWQTVSIERLGIPSIMMTDGPHGLRKQHDMKNAAAMLVPSIPATCFPTAATTACSFDPDLVWRVGRALGEEARDQDVQVVLGPGINVKRSPLCGRNFEYFSEDPLLSGTMGAAMARGLQSTGTGACLKHFVANNREYFRMVTNSIVDERALREIYLRGFEQVVRDAHPRGVMSAYNLLNGTYCGSRKDLIGGTLRNEWSFDGLVVTDWGACYSRVHDLAAGVDLEMPYSGPDHARLILRSIRNGKLAQDALDEGVRNVLRLVERSEMDRSIPYECDYAQHHDIAREAATQSAVLLKNDGLLPVSMDNEASPVALIGAFAKEPRYQGAGSSNIEPKDLEKPYDVMRDRDLSFRYAAGYALHEKDEPREQELLDEAVAVARHCGKAVILAGLPPSWEFEGVDRSNMDMPDSQNRLIQAVASEVPTAVVLCCGSPVEMPWADDVSAILHCYLGGEAGASAMVDLLSGAACPSGKLAESYPYRVEDNPSYRCFDNEIHNVEYRESVYVGYRFYEAAQKKVRFPFGYGLSYATFRLSCMGATLADDGQPRAWATVQNTADVPGAEVVQVYAMGDGQPYQQLAGFRKVFLQPGQSERLEIPLSPRSFQFYADGRWNWQNANVRIGTSSQDIAFSTHLSFNDAKVAPVYAVHADGEWPEEQFYQLFPSRPEHMRTARPFTLNATLRDLQAAPSGQFIKEKVMKIAQTYVHEAENVMTKAVVARYIDENPFRAMVSLSGGAFSYGMAGALLMIANGQLLAGLARLGVEISRMKKRRKKLEENV